MSASIGYISRGPIVGLFSIGMLLMADFTVNGPPVDAQDHRTG